MTGRKVDVAVLRAAGERALAAAEGFVGAGASQRAPGGGFRGQ